MKDMLGLSTKYLAFQQMMDSYEKLHLVIIYSY